MDAKGVIATVLGIIALFAFGVGAYYLAQHIGEQQQQWDRLVYIFGGIEAVAFAAAGYFFGKEVNRARAEKAEETAKKAEDKAMSKEGAKSAAEAKLAALKNYIDTQAPSAGSAQAAVLAELDRLATIPSLAGRPELTAEIDQKRKAASVAADPHWEGLKRFADTL